MRTTKPEFTGFIYAMKYDPLSPSTRNYNASIIARTAGANPRQVSYIDLKHRLFMGTIAKL
jgi:hypothetical protein